MSRSSHGQRYGYYRHKYWRFRKSWHDVKRDEYVQRVREENIKPLTDAIDDLLMPQFAEEMEAAFPRKYEFAEPYGFDKYIEKPDYHFNKTPKDNVDYRHIDHYPHDEHGVPTYGHPDFDRKTYGDYDPRHHVYPGAGVEEPLESLGYEAAWKVASWIFPSSKYFRIAYDYGKAYWIPTALGLLYLYGNGISLV